MTAKLSPGRSHTQGNGLKHPPVPCRDRVSQEARWPVPTPANASRPAPASFIPHCPCQACANLRADRPSQWSWLPHKLLIRGWAGKTDPREKAFIRAHAPWAQRSPDQITQARKNFGKTSGSNQINQDPTQTPDNPINPISSRHSAPPKAIP
jgi:hypothetical protein